MKKNRREVESELRALIPKTPSDRVRDGIANELVPIQRRTSWGNAWVWGAVALAASIAIAVSWWPQPGVSPGESPSRPIVVLPQESADMSPPTMLAYQQVLGRSPDMLDELLDRHATSLLVAGSPSDDLGSLYQDLMIN